MIYLDNGATSFHKPEAVYRAMRCALDNCANPGRGGYPAAMVAAKTVLRSRERAGSIDEALRVMKLVRAARAAMKLWGNTGEEEKE